MIERKGLSVPEEVNNKKFVVQSSRIINCLKKADIFCLESLNGLPENVILRINGLGESSIKELKEVMLQHEFSLDENKFKKSDLFPIYKEEEPNVT